ncbi:heat-shock protein [Candidatus Liberibacter solanacearum]|uniref:Protein GrpE n=3 Tax=Candidatus Liberibacter solanacearum TaxID=556287 RepID=A0A094Z341_9HYPH|nr:nucleotide exchange factor GrpE [Candidatus Liberibacter solanacearum]ADR51868.1 heat shock protein [Candidatus Liberibacter solanacearum CLso-ZC1]KGB27364.1 heat-shock protein [Candidatus Liberibacter solanacearum]KJZ80892.1 heat-shock protein [Candidatus Liberibacter solanacearum]KJZ82038.1 Heat shock protein GrpE [Candidatus Liberibacter solanacearum]KQC49537.1 heat-shock protein [Candidatus Liberibacter solanacearum]
MSEKENNHSNTNEDSVEEKINNNPLEEAQAKAEEFREKYLRVLADMENIRRRTDREIQDAQSYSIAAFARDMLSVSDNLSRALNSVPIDKTQNSDSEIKSLIDGIEMTRREMMSTLEKYGVKKIDAKNQKFNPNIHQAMFEESNETIPSNTVIKVVQDGYAIGERILRPALVGISKGKNKNPVEQIPSQENENKEKSSTINKEENNETQTKG